MDDSLKTKEQLIEELNNLRKVNTALNEEVEIKNIKETELNISKNFIEAITEAIPGVITVFNLKRNIYTYINKSSKKMFGYKPEEIASGGSEIFFSLIHPDDFNKVIEQNQKALIAFNSKENVADNPLFIYEYRIKALNQDWKWVNTYDIVFERDEEGNVEQLMGITIDITERKLAEEKLRASVHEKDILLAEIHHRVKNNMALISGLLYLQSEFTADEKIKNLLKESQNRIKSMMLIHEKLYQKEVLSQIEFGSYVSDLAERIKDSYITSETDIQININIKKVLMSINIAVPCALILNELLSNSFKYAFKNKKQGIIDINLIREHSNYSLTIKDNGVGINISNDKSSSLGLSIVEALVNQLDGKLEILNENGSTFIITFPEHKL